MESLPTKIQQNQSAWAWVGRAWALPYTTLGLLLGLTGKNKFEIVNRVIEIHIKNGPVFWIGNNLGISAFTLGDCVLYLVPPCPNLRFHEGRHIQQYWVLGPMFLSVYYIGLALWGYWNHPLEKDAREHELRHCGCLYDGRIR